MHAAKTELVKSIYQCFYYRGQPKVPASKTHAEWDYDYACLVAYDASESRNRIEAWICVNTNVEKECWNASNILAMVLPAPSNTILVPEFQPSLLRGTSFFAPSLMRGDQQRQSSLRIEHR